MAKKKANNDSFAKSTPITSSDPSQLTSEQRDVLLTVARNLRTLLNHCQGDFVTPEAKEFIKENLLCGQPHGLMKVPNLFRAGDKLDVVRSLGWYVAACIPFVLELAETFRQMTNGRNSFPKTFPKSSTRNERVEYSLQKLKSLTAIIESKAEGKLETTERQRPNAVRDRTWTQWEDDGMTPAIIRDRWNKENPEEKVRMGVKDRGISTVKNAIRRERERQKKL